MISSPKKLSCKYAYVKVYICVRALTHVCEGLSRLKTNILVTKFGPQKKILASPLDPLTNLNSYCHCSNISTINQGIQSIFQPRPPIKTIGHSNFCPCSNQSNSCENVTLFPSSYPAWQFVQPFLFMCYGFFLTLFWSISATKNSLLTPWQQPDRFSLLF